MTKNLREQAIDLLETLSDGKIKAGKKQKKKVSDLNDEGRSMVISLVRELGTVSGITVTEETKDKEILKMFEDTLIADLAEATLNSFKEMVTKMISDELAGLESDYGIQKASELRSLLEVVVEDIVLSGEATKLANDPKAVYCKILQGVERLGMAPADFTTYGKGSPYYEKTKTFNAQQMMNYMEANYCFQ